MNEALNSKIYKYNIAILDHGETTESEMSE